MKKIVFSLVLATALFAVDKEAEATPVITPKKVAEVSTTTIPKKVSASKVTRLDAIKVVGYTEKSGKKRYTNLTPESTVAKMGDGGIQVLELVSSVEFKTDSIVIDRKFKILLEDWVTFLLDRPNIEVLLVGRADMRGPAEYNLRLSKKRANAVKKYLVKSGLKNKIVLLAGGEDDQIANNATPAGLEINRSVEIRFIDQTRADKIGNEQILKALFEPSIDDIPQ